ncbi:long-chain fatty acid--CoA ligase [Bacillus spongiae]|uniref:Long-chain fatty acid--CoA ligase n=1 Tax=Bacillus spongiae TaxID=2683610 RepID=A0ABU8HCC9_9BACI
MSTNKAWLKHYPDSIQSEVVIPNKTLPQVLQDTATKYPQHSAIRFFNQQLTYQQLHTSVQLFAAALQKKNVQKGDRVAIMLPNCPQYVIAFYGTLLAGGIVAQVNPMLVERELEYLLNDSEAETIIVLESLYPRLKSIQANTKVKNVIVVNLKPTSLSVEAEDFQKMIANSAGDLTPVDIDTEQDIAVLQYTGGTTGRSKGAMLTQRNLLANVVQSAEFFKHEFKEGEERILSVVPLFHIFGVSSCMNFAIFAGAESIMLPRFEVEEVLQTINLTRPTIFPGVPTMYVAITHHPKLGEYKLDSIHTCNSGGAPMPVELFKEFERKTGARILEGYGLSETSSCTHGNGNFAERKFGTVGLALPSMDYKIVDLATGEKEVPAGELGEIIIKGPQVMKGYWNMPEETAHALRDGWFYTGDIAKMDEDGYLTIIDRKKDLIIASGFNIYPREVEEVIYEHPSIQEAVVIGVPDAYRGETVKAVVVLKGGMETTEAEIIAFCRTSLASYKVPTTVEFRQQLPKTNVGKILRRSLREEAKRPNNVPK